MKDKVLTLIIGILIGAIIMTCIFVIYTKNNEKDEITDEPTGSVQNEPNFPNPPENDDFQFQGIPQGENGSNNEFQKGSKGDFNRNDSLSGDEARPTLPDGNFDVQRNDEEPSFKPEENQNINTES